MFWFPTFLLMKIPMEENWVRFSCSNSALWAIANSYWSRFVWSLIFWTLKATFITTMMPYLHRTYKNIYSMFWYKIHIRLKNSNSNGRLMRSTTAMGTEKETIGYLKILLLFIYWIRSNSRLNISIQCTCNALSTFRVTNHDSLFSFALRIRLLATVVCIKVRHPSFPRFWKNHP